MANPNKEIKVTRNNLAKKTSCEETLTTNDRNHVARTLGLGLGQHLRWPSGGVHERGSQRPAGGGAAGSGIGTARRGKDGGSVAMWSRCGGAAGAAGTGSGGATRAEAAARHARGGGEARRCGEGQRAAALRRARARGRRNRAIRARAD
jgi:hypothetical protein